jgi:hypothetical protein
MMEDKYVNNMQKKLKQQRKLDKFDLLDDISEEEKFTIVNVGLVESAALGDVQLCKYFLSNGANPECFRGAAANTAAAKGGKHLLVLKLLWRLDMPETETPK